MRNRALDDDFIVFSFRPEPAYEQGFVQQQKKTPEHYLNKCVCVCVRDR